MILVTQHFIGLGVQQKKMKTEIMLVVEIQMAVGIGEFVMKMTKHVSVLYHQDVSFQKTYDGLKSNVILNC